MPGLSETDLSLSKIVDRIILGPSLSSSLARGTIGNMLEALGRSDFKDRIMASTIPFWGRPECSMRYALNDLAAVGAPGREGTETESFHTRFCQWRGSRLL